MSLRPISVTSEERRLHHPMKIHAISQTLPHARYQRCPQCDTLFSLPDVKSHQSAHYIAGYSARHAEGAGRR
ncbi:hypothetical protein GKC49_14800 [Pantoea agglomerans]|uniref:Uncharacterized protein n=1 Tax=Enterobacter agglomerans TaxID=549 RepID=A0A7X2SWR1_ENTAG|nr:hypothetical protein [Pantoea agglomerans]